MRTPINADTFSVRMPMGLLVLFVVGAIHELPLQAGEDKIRIVATTTVLASLVREVTGDTTEIHSVASPKRDLHFISPTPKDVLKVKKADVFVHHGLDTEPWREPLLNAAGDPRFLGESKYSVDTSKGISLLEVPADLSRVQGDIHIFGNTHYWLDPMNVKIMAGNIAAKMGELYPDQAARFRENTEQFGRKLDAQFKEWDSVMSPYRGAVIVTYHRSWPYFAARFGLEVAGQIEPKPGIPPTARHLAGLMRIMKDKKVRWIVKETYNEGDTPEKLARQTGAQVINLSQSVEGLGKGRDYFAMMEDNIRAFQQSENAS